MTSPLATAAPPRAARTRFAASFTVDVEQDCPPYRDTVRGMTEGMPALLDLLQRMQVRGTFFTTGEMARRFPEIIRRLVDAGHELGCHGDLHRDFTLLDRAAAGAELEHSLATLRQFAPVTSFRAPYLRFPAAYVDLLPEHGLTLDSSLARYKHGPDHHDGGHPGLRRIPASVTSSVLRLPRWLRRPWLVRLPRPVVLFVHPWEACDFRRSSLRWDCRFRTGEAALRLWAASVLDLRSAGAVFAPLREWGGP